MNIQEKIKTIQKERGLSNYKLAKDCGLAENTINNLYKRNTLPSITTIEAICKGLGITLSQFFAEDDLVELTPELKELFDNWTSLKPHQKEAVSQLIDSFQKINTAGE